MDSKVALFSGQATRPLAEKIAESYGVKLGNVELMRFSDGEFQVSFEQTLRGSELFLIQSTMAPSENLFELLLMVDAAKRASAHHINAVIPYFGFARQDRKDKPRVAIGAKMVANLLMAAGVDRVITIDLHADQIQGFFDIPVDHLFASSIFIPYLQSLNLGNNIVMASPDTGGTKRANAYSKYLDCDMAICYKQRSKPNQISNMTLIGDVDGRDVVLLDDIVDTAGTLCKSAELMMNAGAKSVRAMCTHGVFSGKAYENIDNSVLTELIVTDTITKDHKSSKVKVLSVAELLADVIKRNLTCESISTHFNLNTLI
ncbi:MAG: ribose-phosphate pyrophosphokinase [Bacteroidales bacterium]|jgi:ribose-phosphate pyrophosphokinase|nr:ribose-phosphate pyrophosphokinase [Bacteroidales bacterium]HPF00531.1 ribose-phosphate pyrophosphokinase [Bacteroidales bacterium]